MEKSSHKISLRFQLSWKLPVKMFSHSKRLADVTFYCRRRHVYRQKISFMIYFAMTERLPIWNCVFDLSSVVFNRISHFVNCDSNPDPRSHLVEGDEDSYLPYWRTKVASNTRGQQFESSPVIKNCYTGHLLSVNCIEKTKIKKVTGNGLYPPPPNCRVLRAHRRSWPSPSCCWWDSNPRRC